MEWISVEERLPETGIWVLGLVELPTLDGLWPMVVFRMGMAETGWWNANDPSQNDEMYPQDVRYWMPLPKAPEVVDAED